MKTVRLAELTRPAGARAGSQTDVPVYSVTKHAGFVPSLEYFKKQVFSRDVADYKLVQPGDFAYATIHLDEGSIGIAPERGLISPMYTAFSVDTNRVDPAYLLFFLKSPRALAEYPALGRGAINRRKAISLSALGTLKVPLPGIDEQRRIANLLELARGLGAQRNAISVNFEELRKARFVEMFGDPNRAHQSPGSLRFDELFRDDTRNSRKVPTSEFEPEGRFPIVDQGARPIAGWKSDFAITTDAGCGVVVFGDHTRQVKLVTERFVLGADGAKVLRPLESVEPRWAATVLELIEIPNLGYSRHMKVVRELRFPRVGRDEQEKFSRFAERLEREIDRQRSAIRLDEELFASLQHRAFSGML